MLQDIIWTQKHRPRTIDDCILPRQTKAIFQKIVEDGDIPNLLLAGPSGMGKTTAAVAMLEQLGVDYIIINGSLNGNIDTLRNEIQKYAASVSLVADSRKMVILDEADYLGPLTQPALRNFMETFSKNCGFILTCNIKSKIIDAIQSRCSTVDFIIPRDEAADLKKAALLRLFNILDTEKVPYDRRAVGELLKRHFPDLRKVINELQKYARTGSIDAGLLGQQSGTITELVDHIKAKDFAKMRQWVAAHGDMDIAQIVTDLYRELYPLAVPDTIPFLILHLNEHDYKHGFCTNKEVNVVAMLLRIMADVEFQ